MIFVELNEWQIERLIKCKIIKDGRDFRNWDMKMLLNEAIAQFQEKYNPDAFNKSS